MKQSFATGSVPPARRALAGAISAAKLEPIGRQHPRTGPDRNGLEHERDAPLYHVALAIRRRPSSPLYKTSLRNNERKMA